MPPTPCSVTFLTSSEEPGAKRWEWSCQQKHLGTGKTPQDLDFVLGLVLHLSPVLPAKSLPCSWVVFSFLVSHSEEFKTCFLACSACQLVVRCHSRLSQLVDSPLPPLQTHTLAGILLNSNRDWLGAQPEVLLGYPEGSLPLTKLVGAELVLSLDSIHFWTALVHGKNLDRNCHPSSVLVPVYEGKYTGARWATLTLTVGIMSAV